MRKSRVWLQVVPLHWWPISRDCFFYAVSISALVLTICDGQVLW